MSPGSPPSRASVRRLLDEILRTDAELDAFCLDHFPQVQRRFSEGMERVKKLNLLLQTESTEQILQHLLKRQPDARARLHEIESENASEPATAMDPRSGSTDRLPLPPESQVLSRPLASVLWSTLSTTRGLLRTALCLLFTAVLLWGAGSQPRWSPGALILVGLALAASLGWLLHTIWQRWRIPSVSTTRFVGPLPMEEGDAGRFFGREAKIEELKAKLAQRSVRHILVFGVSGCGKTSLLRAGLIARLRAEQRFECVYLRFTDDPVGALQRALRAIGLPEKTAPADPAATLVGDLQQACTRSQLPILLCIDQFEEFQINPIGGDGFRQVLDLIWAISGSQPLFDNVKLVLSLREDFLSLLTDFYQDKGFAQGEEKVRVEPFEEQVAKEVIERLLHSESGGLIWDATLVRRVLDDLVFEKLSHGERRRYVLPTELQIVFQMVQSRRIYRDENYPGKKKLLLDYISEAIATVPGADPPLVKQLLLSLIDAGGQTKAKPQTLAQLANQVQADAETVRRILLHLDLNRHVVRSFHPDKPARTPSPPTGAIASAAEALHYELAHDYLAGVIRIVAGAEMSGAKRSQALVEMARLRAQDDPGYRMPILDCVQLWRYPAEQSTPEDRALLRRSLWSFGLRYCLPMLGLFLLASFIRFGTHTIRLQYTRQGSEVVLIRGIAALQPLLGAREPSAWTGLSVDSDWHAEPSTQALVKDLTAGIWRPSGLAFLRSDWDPDRYLRRRVAQAARPLAFPQGEGCLYTKKFDDEFAYLLLATSADLNQEVSAYAQAMDCGLRSYLSRCAAEVSKTEACTEHATVLKSLASLLGRVGARDSLKALPVYLSSRPSDAAISVQALEILADLVERSLPRDAGNVSADNAAMLHALRQSIVRRMVALNAALPQGSSTDVRLAHDVAQLIDALKDSGKPTGLSIATLIDNPTLLPSIRDALIRALAQPIKLAERRSLVRALVSLSREDPVTIGYLLSQLSSQNTPIQIIAFSTLLDMNPKQPELRSFFENLLINTLSELKKYDHASVFPLSEHAVNTLNLFSGLLSRCDEADLREMMTGPHNPLAAFGTANYEELMGYYRRFKQASTDAGLKPEASHYITIMDGEFETYSKLLKLWDLPIPRSDILNIIDSLTSQQGPLTYYDKDIRVEIFLPQRDARNTELIEEQIRTDTKLRTKIESMILESPAGRQSDCSWLAVAIRYNISKPSIREKRVIRQDDCSHELPSAIARYEILGNPTGSDAQTLAHGVSKLRDWLRSPDGANVRHYQSILLNGYRFLAQLLQNEPERRAAWIAQQRRALTNNLRRDDLPLRQRLADLHVLQYLN